MVFMTSEQEHNYFFKSFHKWNLFGDKNYTIVQNLEIPRLFFSSDGGGYQD